MTPPPSTLLLLLLLAAGLAGCADPAAGPSGPASAAEAASSAASLPLPSPPAPFLDLEEVRERALDEARALYRQALWAEHGRVGLDVRAHKDGVEGAAYQGFLDEAANTAWIRARMEPAVWGQETGGERGLGLDAAMREGMDFYYAPGFSVIHGRGLAQVSPLGDEATLETMFAQAPVMEMLRSAYPSNGSAFDGLRVRNVTPALHDGVPALDLGMRGRSDQESAEGTVRLLVDPPRIVQARLHVSGRGDVLDGADLSIGLTYGDDAPAVPADVLRVSGLAHRRDPAADGSGNETWTFLVDGGIPLDEVEVSVRTANADADWIQDAPERGFFRLSAGSAEVDGVLVVFEDVDADGLVSAGDTLRHNGTSKDDLLALRDVTTGTHVVPGPAIVALLGVALLVALALRRR